MCVCATYVWNTGRTIRSCGGWSKVGHETATRTCSNPWALRQRVTRSRRCAALTTASRVSTTLVVQQAARIFGSVGNGKWRLACGLSFGFRAPRGSSFNRSVFPFSRWSFSSDANHGDSRADWEYRWRVIYFDRLDRTHAAFTAGGESLCINWNVFERFKGNRVCLVLREVIRLPLLISCRESERNGTKRLLLRNNFIRNSSSNILFRGWLLTKSVVALATDCGP